MKYLSIESNTAINDFSIIQSYGLEVGNIKLQFLMLNVLHKVEELTSDNLPKHRYFLLFTKFETRAFLNDVKATYKFS